MVSQYGTIGLRPNKLPNGERCLAVRDTAFDSGSFTGEAGFIPAGEYGPLVARIQDCPDNSQKNETVKHPPQGFVHFSAVAVGRSIVCSEYKTITNRSLVAGQDEEPER
jgi:hypothetical protein